MSEVELITKMAVDLLITGLATEEDGCVVPSRLGTQLGMSNVEFFTWLRRGGFMYREGMKNGSGKNLPTQEALDLGFMRVESRVYKGEESDQALITPTGIRQLAAHYLTNPTDNAKKVAMALCLAQGWVRTPPVP